MMGQHDGLARFHQALAGIGKTDGMAGLNNHPAARWATAVLRLLPRQHFCHEHALCFRPLFGKKLTIAFEPLLLDEPLHAAPLISLRCETLGILAPCLIKLAHSPAHYTLISDQCGRSTCMQHLSMTAFTCSLRCKGCLMVKLKQLISRSLDDVPA